METAKVLQGNLEKKKTKKTCFKCSVDASYRSHTVFSMIGQRKNAFSIDCILSPDRSEISLADFDGHLKFNLYPRQDRFLVFCP